MAMTIEEIKKKNVEMCVNSGWNIYEWCDKHPDTTIAAAMKRIEKIMDFSDFVQIGTSGGKDSTVTGNLVCLELNLRRLRVQNNIMRDGTPGIDPLDKKWIGKRIHSCSTNAEVVFSDTNDYIHRFLKKYGPEKWYDLGGKEYRFDEKIKLTDDTIDTAENIFNKIMLGEEIEISD